MCAPMSQKRFEEIIASEKAAARQEGREEMRRAAADWCAAYERSILAANRSRGEGATLGSITAGQCAAAIRALSPGGVEVGERKRTCTGCYPGCDLCTATAKAAPSRPAADLGPCRVCSHHESEHAPRRPCVAQVSKTHPGTSCCCRDYVPPERQG